MYSCEYSSLWDNLSLHWKISIGFQGIYHNYYFLKLWRFGLVKVDTPNPIWTLNISTLRHECCWEETIAQQRFRKTTSKSKWYPQYKEYIFSNASSRNKPIFTSPFASPQFYTEHESLNLVKKLKVSIYGCIVLEHCTPHAIMVHDMDMDC
jgi:hypothetical protein